MQNPIIPNSAVKVGIIADIHFPFQSDVHLERATDIFREEKPDVIVVNGDLVDFFGISKYNTNPSLDFLMKAEIPMAKDFLFELRRDHPQATIVMVEGNHEFRIRSFLINNARPLYQILKDLMPDDILPTLLDMPKLNIEWVGTNPNAAKWTDTFFHVDDIKIGHFDKVSNPVIPGGMTVRQLMAKGGGSYVQAHIHRAAIIYNTDFEGTITWGMETPCLAANPHYRGYVNWARGVSFLNKHKGRWQPHLIVFND